MASQTSPMNSGVTENGLLQEEDLLVERLNEARSDPGTPWEVIRERLTGCLP